MVNYNIQVDANYLYSPRTLHLCRGVPPCEGWAPGGAPLPPGPASWPAGILTVDILVSHDGDICGDTGSYRGDGPRTATATTTLSEAGTG